MVLVGTTSCGWWSAPEEVPASPPPGPHVLLVLVDTLRADHLGAHGDPRGLTPNLDALAARGTRFAQARSAASTTLASTTSLLTGRYPHTHGVYRNGVRWPAGLTGLPTAMSDAGYETAGFVSSTPLYRQQGIDRGFDHWEQSDGLHHRRSDETLGYVSAWLDARESEAPFFAFVHLFDPHYPYQPPPPYDTRFAEAPYDGWFDGSSAHVKKLRRQTRRRKGEPNADTRQAEALYAGEVAHVDAQIGAFLDGMREDGLLDDTLVIVTGDHGESFTEHGRGFFDHGWTVHDTEVHVPLIVAGPGVPAGAVVDEHVSLIDVAPTLRVLLGLPADDGEEGVSLVPALTTGAQDGLDDRPTFSEATKPHRRDPVWPNRACDRAVVWEAHKLYHRPGRDQWALYQPVVDPLERRDLWDETPRPPEVDDLQLVLDAWAARGPETEGEMTTDPEVIEGLRALGYVE